MREHTTTIRNNVRRAEESVGVRNERCDKTAALAAHAIRIARAATSIHLTQSAGLPSPDLDHVGEQIDMLTNDERRNARERQA